MFKNMKISIKILLVILIMTLGALMMVFATSYYFMNSMVNEFQMTNITLGINNANSTKDALLSQAEDYLGKLVQKQAQAANEELYAVNMIVTESAGYTSRLYNESQYFTGKDMPRPDETEAGVASAKYFLAKGTEETAEVMKEVKNLSSCEYMFSEMLKNNPMLDNIYIGTESGISYRYSRSNAFNPDYDPRERGWYKAAMENQDTLVWLPTYLDSYGNTCITAAMSYRDENGKTVGVVASDVLLTSIIDDVMSLKLAETGTCFMIDAEHAFIAHPDMQKEDFNPELAAHFENNDFIDALGNSDNGIEDTVYEGKDCYVAFSTLAETGWIFCASIETGEVTEPAQRARAMSDELTATSQNEMQAKLSNIYRWFMIFFAVVGILVIMSSFAVAGTITRPIQKLTASVHDIGEGNFDKKVPVESKDEVGELASKFNEMQDNLKTYMENIRKVTAENERIGAELQVATQIQVDILPRVFPCFPERDEFKMFASMTPAKEVGGDFYDFFLIDDSHLALVMADVSGKGVPAALFMVIAKTLIKNRAQLGGTPSEVLSFVNDQLCDGNEAELFVTVWLAILDINTGKGMAANAGHEHPALKRVGQPWELIKYRHSPAVATMEGMKFKEHEFELHKGDRLFVYTDGATEATNSQNELFGEERLVNALNREDVTDPNKIIANVREDIDAFVAEAPQFDDLTMLSFVFYGKQKE